MTFLSLSMLLASCAQDETRDEVMPTEKQVAVNGSNTDRFGSLTSVKFIKESGPMHPQVLNTDESLTLEHNGSVYRLIMQIDNNLVLYRERQGHKTVLWHSNTHRIDVVKPKLIAQTDGNLVIYASNSIPVNSIPIWHSNTTVNYMWTRHTLKSSSIQEQELSFLQGTELKLFLVEIMKKERI